MTNKIESSYDLNHILEIHNKKIRTQAEIDEEHAARKSDPKLDSMLYEQDKAEALDFISKVQQILRKAMSGQSLTKEEQEMIKNDPNLAMEVNNRRSGLFVNIRG